MRLQQHEANDETTTPEPTLPVPTPSVPMLPERTISEKRYDEATLRQAIQLAAQLEKEHQERFTAEEVEAIAEEVGVDRRFVRRALEETAANTEEQQPRANQTRGRTRRERSPRAAEVAQQVTGQVSGVAKKVKHTLDTAPAETLNTWTGVWWATGWTFPFMLEGLAHALHTSDGALFFAGWATYIGGGILLAKKAEIKKKLGENKATANSDGSVSRSELLEQLFALQTQLEGTCVRRAFLSVDVVGSSQMKADNDSLSVEYSFNAYHQFVQQIVASEGGQMQSAAGDGIMGMFESETAAVRVARKLQMGMRIFNTEKNRLRSPFRIRCGINAGEVAIEPGKSLGALQSPVVDRAALLQKAARPGDIVVSGSLSRDALGELGVHAPLDEPIGGGAALSWRAGLL